MNTFMRASVAGIVLLMLACKKEPQLPELPASLTDSLVQVGTSDVFVSALKTIGPKPSIDGVDLRCVKKCAAIEIEWVQVTYPITVCFPPDFPTQNIMTMYKEGQEPDSVAAIIASKTSVTHQMNRRVGGYNQLFCKRHGGPWIAEIQDQEQCGGGCGPGPHKYSMTILGVQQNLYWEWWGTLDGRPQEVVFIGEPWPRGHSVVDCDPGDLTNCSGGIPPPDQPAVSPAQPDSNPVKKP
jgi:hypothetical protein